MKNSFIFKISGNIFKNLFAKIQGYFIQRLKKEN